ncbi:MAG: vitamin B12-dependent ribonucleotide reductase [Candidatus Omnitrophota bacterium]|nr:vitamin B12-dependent ribonucleotide reductase [Candidatus Omnitrophota bacterium]
MAEGLGTVRNASHQGVEAALPVGSGTSAPRGLPIPRRWTRPTVHPFDEIAWELRSASIANEKGEMVFEQHEVEVPNFWSQLATNVVVSKYFRGTLGTAARERSVKQLIGRVANTISDWGVKDGYFATEEDAEAFRAELTYLLVHQYTAFNSPVWFNVGIEPRPQCSACQPYHALINTASGLIPIGDIVKRNLVGLPVYDADGLTQVVAVKQNGRKPVYRVTLNDGFSVEATADHLVCAHTTRRTSRIEWCRVDHLQPGMVMRVYAHTSKTVTVVAEAVAVSEAALAGWLQADGFVGQYDHGTNQSLTAEFMTVDDQEHAWVMGHVERAFPGRHYHVTDVATDDPALRCRRIRFYGEWLRPFVERYGLLRRGQELRIPEPLWTAPNDAAAAYVKSLFQSDGYAAVHVPSAHVAFAVTSQRWAEELQRLLTRFGIYARLRRKKERRPDRYDMWELDVSIRSEREAFQHSIGFISERKNAKLRESLSVPGKRCPEIRYSTIVSIEPIGEMEVYDIQTLSGCYLTNSVLVHNCFILSVDDTMESILEWYRNEGMIFKYGSGSGLNVSPIRSARERLAGGGTASGPVSFMRAADPSAGVIKSGGKTRRAAKMIVLNADHPDIKPFILCKWKEEEKAHKLIDLGYDASIDGEAYMSVFFQNANNSVRVTDEFMKRALADEEWELRAVTTGEVIERVKARDLLRLIAEATWHCGDPGMQFDTTTNDWHTCPNTGRINASNPCSEYVHLDNSACNLASVNLMKFLDDEGNFLIEPFKHAVRIMTIAQDIIVDNSSYPTAKIERTARDYRQLGLGYANLGALLMSLGIPYDSEEGRAWAGAITALTCGHAYEVSGQIAEQLGSYAGFASNREPHLRVLRKHRSHVDKINSRLVPESLLRSATRVWDEAIRFGERCGVRNAQVTVLAPTGTISFLLDCDTTGVEPDIALVKYKRLVGGGMLKIVNQTVPRALKRLGYEPREVEAIVQHIDEHDTIEGAPGLKPEHLSIFDCAFRPIHGTRFIHSMGHVRMMAAAQPFISGAISKTINMPEAATVEEIMQAYTEAWRLGLKAVAIYRDGSKRVQPLSTSKEDKGAAAKAPVGTPYRRRLPDERQAITHKFSIGGHEGYLTVGLFEDGQPGEIFIVMSKEGSTLSGVMDCFATTVSLSLQYGVPLKVLVNKFNHVRFEPSGVTNNKDIRFAKSVIDYIFRWMALKFLPPEQAQEFKVTELPGTKTATAPAASHPNPMEQQEKVTFVAQADAPACSDCGSLMVRNGNCYKCLNCGSTSGCS